MRTPQPGSHSDQTSGSGPETQTGVQRSAPELRGEAEKSGLIRIIHVFGAPGAAFQSINRLRGGLRTFPTRPRIKGKGMGGGAGPSPAEHCGKIHLFRGVPDDPAAPTSKESGQKKNGPWRKQEVDDENEPSSRLAEHERRRRRVGAVSRRPATGSDPERWRGDPEHAENRRSVPISQE